MLSVHDVAATGHRVMHPAAEARWWHRAPVFVVVGGAWTALYLLLYAVLRDPLGAQVANVTALVLTTVGSTDSHRDLTFTARGGSRVRHLAHQSLGLGLLVVGLAVTSGSLWLLHALTSDTAAFVELVVLVAANAVAGSIRFGVFLAVMRPRRAGDSELAAA